ncbi:glycosyltransferase family 1 protein [Actinoplanes sp. ATCC 53533]|uniref:glycosyltransferase family 4 protein n=1 Tax=Actinoplanes sp. ATCC 53533 TaxID=1288362 RepID=UPI000F787E25|nr:glycosyltransferase family 4 protein [Actinoplanes sp. ATCC 53533]RSM52171.1 glycosyltransferase family 1 protein [Actinoplanes sp. ATCC 53533]
MRIALVCKRYPPHTGGVEEHVSALAAEYVKRGDQVSVLTYGTAPRLTEECLGGVRVRRFALSVTAPNFEYSRSMAGFLGTSLAEFDVVHAHSYHALPALSAALARPRALVFTPHYHGTGHSRLRSALHHVYRPAGRKIIDAARRIICVTRAERDTLLGHFPRAAEKAVVVPNGTRRPAAASSAAADRLIAEVRPTDVITVGRLESYKGVDHAIASLSGLPGHVRLHVVGEGPGRSAAEAQASRAGLAGRVFFHGRLPRQSLDRAVARCGAVLCLSRHEAFGLVLAEALVAGARVVASDIPAHRSVVADAGASRLVAFWGGRRADLAAVIAATLARPAAGQPVSMPGWADVAERTRALYTEARAGSAVSAAR